MADVKKLKAMTPRVDNRGAIMTNVGKYARDSVLTAYEMIGGHGAFAEWAEENKGEFYTKIYPKIIGREVELKADDSIESLLDKLDRRSTIIDGVAKQVDIQDVEDVE